MSNIESCLEKVTALMGEMLDVLNELKSKSEPCKVDSKEPEYRKRVFKTSDSKYYYTMENNCPMVNYVVDCTSDVIKPQIGNYLYTVKQAQKLANLRNQCDPVTALIIEVTDNDNWTPDWNNPSQRKYYAVYDYDHKQWNICCACSRRSSGIYYFNEPFVEKVEVALNKHFPNGYPK